VLDKKELIIATVTNDLTTDQRMIRICSELTNLHFNVLLVGRMLPDSIHLKNHAFQQVRLRCIRNKGPLFYLEYNWRLYRFLKKKKPQIINTVDTDTAAAAWVYQIFHKVKVVYDSHEYFTEVPELQGRYLVQKVWRFLERRIVKNSVARYTVCDSIATEYQKLYKKNFATIRNVPFKRSLPVVKPKKSNSDKKILLYQGALNKGRCVDLFIQAMHKLDAELWIAGEGDLSSELRQLAMTEGLEQKVKFLGRLTPQDLWEVTTQVDVGLNVLEHMGKSYYYSLSNKFFDYVQASVPVISSPFPEYLKLNEIHEVQVFSPNDTVEFQEKVNLLLNDASVYNRLKENCVIAAKDWIWENERKKLAEVYEGI
jgi:glycosyltransferase involved in cell wall biosynthesis